MAKEASARLLINDLLIKSWRRLVDNESGEANVKVEANVVMESLGDDFEKTEKWFIDYLLVDNNGFPLCILEAKSSDKDPLIGKEQARRYAQAKNVRFIILSNGSKHYFRDRESGNPQIIFHFPRMEEMRSYSEESKSTTIQDLINMTIDHDFLAKLKKPQYQSEVDYQNTETRSAYCRTNKLRFMRSYQTQAIQSLQRWIKEGKQRFLFEMATWTGKTLTSAGIINMFLKSWVAKRVLFLVDRVELENQAWKSFTENLWTDYKSIIFKKNRDDRKQAEIVVSTIQTFAYNNKYKDLFSPYDFGLIISDESHRSVSGSNRAVFEYFIWYKLWLTATPKDYLKKIDSTTLRLDDPRELERRELLDTYKIFWCETWDPTYRYSLKDGVNDPDGPFLVNPISIDCRTEITTDLLSKEWYKVTATDEEWEEIEKIFWKKQYEKTFFSEETNEAMIKAFMDNALCDPISWEIGKTIIFAVSRKHASKLTQLLNKLAHEYFPGKYQSDFAMQVTSDVPEAQQATINFANNKLNGHTNFLPDYDSSKTRVCVTVGMMTTGYDCEDILNLCLCRPIFSPTDFVQIKGRGTRICDFRYEEQSISKKDLRFKMFDFFANCQYFEQEYDYDQIIPLPKVQDNLNDSIDPNDIYDADAENTTSKAWWYENTESDYIKSIDVTNIGSEGMKIDRELYAQDFEKSIQEQVHNNPKLKELAESFDELWMEHYAVQHIENKPSEFYNLTKLNESYNFERPLGRWEIIMKALGLITRFKTKQDLIDEAWDNFTHTYESKCINSYEAKQMFRAYCLDKKLKHAIDSHDMWYVAVNPMYQKWLKLLWAECIKIMSDYINIENSKLLQLGYK